MDLLNDSQQDYFPRLIGTKMCYHDSLVFFKILMPFGSVVCSFLFQEPLPIGMHHFDSFCILTEEMKEF